MTFAPILNGSVARCCMTIRRRCAVILGTGTGPWSWPSAANVSPGCRGQARPPQHPLAHWGTSEQSIPPTFVQDTLGTT